MRAQHTLPSLGLAILVMAGGCRREPATPAVPATSAPAPAVSAEPARLVGAWQRPDGGYVLQIRAATPDGQLDAGYFNPNPIRVAKATWVEDAQGLTVFVELQDVNYPGATYKLRYRPESDAMTGLYTQPKLGQTFEVEFHRQPAAPSGPPA